MWAQRTHSITSHPIWVTPAPHEPKGGGGGTLQTQEGEGSKLAEKGPERSDWKAQIIGKPFLQKVVVCLFSALVGACLVWRSAQFLCPRPVVLAVGCRPVEGSGGPFHHQTPQENSLLIRQPGCQGRA